MTKYKKMLGTAKNPYIIELRSLVENLSKETVAHWCIDYTEKVILPIFEKYRPEDIRPQMALSAARDWFRGLKKLPELKRIILYECHGAARELNDYPAAQAAARACGHAAACFHTQGHSLGLAFYGIAAIAYDQIGINQPQEVYEQILATECSKMIASLREVVITE